MCAKTGSRASRDGRTELQDILEFVREGDELVVHRLDRLGRSTRDVLNLMHELDGRGASLRVLKPEVTIMHPCDGDGGADCRSCLDWRRCGRRQATAARSETLLPA